MIKKTCLFVLVITIIMAYNTTHPSIEKRSMIHSPANKASVNCSHQQTYQQHVAQYYSSCCQQQKKGPRGKRGHHGKRGPTGVTGPTGATGATGAANLFDELFINAPMMTNMVAATPNTFFSVTYGTPTALEAWELPSPLFTEATPIGTQFIIPDTLDRTQPVTLTIHCFNMIEEASGNIKLQIQADYKANGEELGINSPSGGYAETLLTNSIPIVDPTGSAALRYFTTTISLDPSLMINKTWCTIVTTLVLTGDDDDYEGSIFLTALSVKYTKTST